MVGDFVAKATALSNALQHTVNHLQTIQQELERSNPVAALQIKLERIESTRDRFEALEAALSRHCTSVSGDTLVDKLENIKSKIVDEDFTQLKNWNLSNNVIASTQEEIGNILAILERWNTAKSQIVAVQNAVDANDKDSATTLLKAWTTPLEEDADTLTTLVEDFAAAVRLYVRVLNRFPDTPSILKVVPGEVGDAKGSLKGKIQFDKETPIGPFYGVFNTKVGDDNTATNEDVYRHPEIGVRNAINDVYAGRDVVVLGYGVSGSGKSYTLLGEQSGESDQNGIAQMFLDDFAKTKKFKEGKHTISMCVKELYGTTPSLHPDIGSALMSGSIYEFAPTEMIREIILSNSTTSTKIEYEAKKDRKWKRIPKHTIRAVTSDTIDTVRHSYNDDQIWDFVAVSSPQSIEDITTHVAHNVNAVDLACSLDPCKFVRLTNPLADFKKVYQKVQDLRSSRKLTIEKNQNGNSMLYYKDTEVGEYFPNDGQILLKMEDIGYSLLLEQLLDNEGGGGYSMQETRREKLYTTFMSGQSEVKTLIVEGTEKDIVKWRFPIDENNDEGFMLSTNENTIILPRIFQRKSASVRPNISAVETLRNFDHEKSTPNNPRSSRGILFLVFRIQLANGEVAHLTIADFPGVEDPTAIAKAFAPGKFETEEQALSNIRYHPPYAQESQYDAWSYCKTAAHGGYSDKSAKTASIDGKTRLLETIGSNTHFKFKEGQKFTMGDTTYTLQTIKAEMLTFEPRALHKKETVRLKLKNKEWTHANPAVIYQDPVPLTPDQFKTVREGQYINTMLAHLKAFIGKSNGRTSSWSTTHDTSLIDWQNNPAFYWSEHIEHVFPWRLSYVSTPTDYAHFTYKHFPTRFDVKKQFDPERPKLNGCPSNGFLSKTFAAPFTSSADMWIRQVREVQGHAPAISSNECLTDQGCANPPCKIACNIGIASKTITRALYELSHSYNWLKWFQSLDANGFTNKKEPTRGNILLIELLSGMISAKSVDSSKNAERATQIRKDPKIIVMNMLRTDGGGSRGESIRASANYTNSLRVDATSRLPKTKYLCENEYPLKKIPVLGSDVDHHKHVPEPLFRAWAGFQTWKPEGLEPADIEAQRNTLGTFTLLMEKVQYGCKTLKELIGSIPDTRTDSEIQAEKAAQAKAAALKTGLAALEKACKGLGTDCKNQMMSQFRQFLLTKSKFA